MNNGGNTAPGQGVETGTISGPQTPITPSNGNIVFSASLPAPPAPNPADVCPSGKTWHTELVPGTLLFEDVVLHFEQPAGTEVLTVPLGDIDP